MWHKPCRTFHPWCPCTKTRCLSSKQVLTASWVQSHDDVIKWKHFPRYWPFVRRIHRSPVNSPYKGQWRGALMFYLICVWTQTSIRCMEVCGLNKRFSKQSWSWWFETLSCPLWRLCNDSIGSYHPGPFLLTWINFNPRMEVVYTHYKMWDEIIHPFLNVKHATVEVWEWIRNFIPHFTGHGITYPCKD